MEMVEGKDEGSVKNLQYIFYIKGKRPKNAFSLEIHNSDVVTNNEVLNNLVGTLVKYDLNGHFFPYLAKGWTFSKDHKKWSFPLKPHLKFDNGDPITAEGFVSRLQERLLWYYKKKGGALVFERLEGFNDFVQGKSHSISGLFAEKDTVHFHFTGAPDDFLEFLNMPYFGYWHQSNDELAKKGQFISSAAYSLKGLQGTTAILKKRKDWPLENTRAPEEVVFSKTNLLDEKIPSQRAIVQVGHSIPSSFKGLNRYRIATSTPAILSAIVLSPYKGPFKDVQLRRAFAARLKGLLEKNPIHSRVLSSAQGFYFNSAPLPFTKYKDSLKLEGKITVNNALSKDLIEKLKPLLEEIVQPFGVELAYDAMDASDRKSLERVFSNKYYDIRMAGVHSGSTYMNDTIKMMFCSRMGVSFPDPSGRICELVAEHEKNKDSYSRKKHGITQDYRDRFNQYLLEDAAVIPVFHSRFTTLFSKDLNIITTPVDLDLFPMELVQLKD